MIGFLEEYKIQKQENSPQKNQFLDKKNNALPNDFCDSIFRGNMKICCIPSSHCIIDINVIDLVSICMNSRVEQNISALRELAGVQMDISCKKNISIKFWFFSL